MTRYIIVDDEPLAHELIEEFCSMLPHLELQQNCYNAFEAMQYLNGNQTDLMFLDLNMPKLKGFDFLRTLPNPPRTIVTTAYKEFAIEGYELNIADYLVKPFSFERFVKAVNKAMLASAPVIAPQTSTSTHQVGNLRFFVKGDKKYHQVSSSAIMYIEAFGNYTKLYLTDQMIVCNEKISYFEGMLPTANFLRVHKSFIVALDKITTIEGNRIFLDKYAVPIGQTYKSKVNGLFNH